MDMQRFSPTLRSKDGIYFSPSGSAISYPDQGNALCYQVEENSFWFRHRNNCILSLINKFQPQTPLFDIGGGNGFVTRSLQRNGVNAVLLEPGIEGALNAKKRGVNDVICSTLQDAGFRNGSLPSAGLFDVVEHIQDDVQFLQTVNRFLEPSGLLFVTVPALDILWSTDDKATGHFRRYSVKSLSSVLTAAGFKMRYISYFFMPLTVPVFLMRSLPSAIGLNKKPINESKVTREHTSHGVLAKFLDGYWNWEVKKISNGKTLPFGSSCIAVAEKI